jgi:hypothetical protein
MLKSGMEIFSFSGITLFVLFHASEPDARFELDPRPSDKPLEDEEEEAKGECMLVAHSDMTSERGVERR